MYYYDKTSTRVKVPTQTRCCTSVANANGIYGDRKGECIVDDDMVLLHRYFRPTLHVVDRHLSTFLSKLTRIKEGTHHTTTCISTELEQPFTDLFTVVQSSHT